MVFAEHDIDLEDFSAVKHVIDTKDVRPVKKRLRRPALAFEGEEKNTLKTFGCGYYYQGCFRVGVPYSVGLEEGRHCHILY